MSKIEPYIDQYKDEILKLDSERKALFSKVQANIGFHFSKRLKNIAIGNEYKTVFPGLQSKVIVSGDNDITISLWKSIKGAYIDSHHHVEIQSIYVLSGEIEINLPEQSTTMILKENDSIIIPAGEIKSLKSLDKSLFIVKWRIA